MAGGAQAAALRPLVVLANADVVFDATLAQLPLQLSHAGRWAARLRREHAQAELAARSASELGGDSLEEQIAALRKKKDAIHEEWARLLKASADIVFVCRYIMKRNLCFFY